MMQETVAASHQDSRVVVEHAPIRRFELPDLDRHGGWLVERLVRAFFRREENDLPMGQTSAPQLAAFLKGCIYSNEFLFLYCEHACALAQLDFGGSLAPLPVVRERFVFVQDAQNAAHMAEGVEFYDNFIRWARHSGAKAVIVGEMSDVPEDLIREKVGGRLMKREMRFVRVQER